MSEKQLREMLDRYAAWAGARFKQKGVITPMYHVVTASGEELAMDAPHTDKDTGVAMMRAFFELKDVVRYVFMDEAWTILHPISEAEVAFVDRHGVRSHPDRVEIVMLSGEDHEYGQIVLHRRIIRPASGKPYLGPLVSVDETLSETDRRRAQSAGRMVGMLPKRGKIH